MTAKATSSTIGVIYIRATPERVWQALTDPVQTAHYWSHENVSDWRVGSAWEHRRLDGTGAADVVGKVVAAEPPRTLVLSWAGPGELGQADKTSRVTITIEDAAVGETAPASRVTVEHDQLERQHEALVAVSDGWPRVLSSLKSFIETGQPLRTWPH